MAARTDLLGCLLVAIVAVLLHPSAAQSTTHVVGDSLGWRIPPGGPIAYSTWASSNTFMVGDILVFNFTTGQHDVAEVTKTDFDNCDGSSTIGSVQTTGPARITLNSQGQHYYICTFNGHCAVGQKLAINVLPSGSSTTPSSSGSPTSSPAPTAGGSAPNSAPAVAVAGISATLLSFTVAFLF
ncbi:PREDICTED: umecyanin-like [Nelumbo nucifera]|uniref:Umecyanin-like n=2 Tax=Nelumbo nucifera TaxID=4432 RepID=A0A1U7ZPV3_NELNU|nr:PREDICTED: umecyanin-like [Nelumbo nucifera]DAD44941.1 TPA_asm: hypothetical protein HUJ06_003171 [Nelumbo nucifera]